MDFPNAKEKERSLIGFTEKEKQDFKWLSRYKDQLDNKFILELGCGDGKDTQVLQTYTSSVIAADLNPELNPYAIKIILNHSSPLPFAANTFDVVVASLCLHYFSWPITLAMFKDIARILKKEGLLICRLNSDQDTHHGADSEVEIEPGLFDVQGQLKRFFTEHDVRTVLEQDFDILLMDHKTIDRYQLAKNVFEVTANKKV